VIQIVKEVRDKDALPDHTGCIGPYHVDIRGILLVSFLYLVGISWVTRLLLTYSEPLR